MARPISSVLFAFNHLLQFRMNKPDRVINMWILLLAKLSFHWPPPPSDHSLFPMAYSKSYKFLEIHSFLCLFPFCLHVILVSSYSCYSVKDINHTNEASLWVVTKSRPMLNFFLKRHSCSL
jgi:hypothetical protein